MVHCGSIRQTASIISMDREFLRTGDKAIVQFKFIKHPEFIRPGQRMVFREGRTKAVRSVLKLLFAPAFMQQRVKANKAQNSHPNTDQKPKIQQRVDFLLALIYPNIRKMIINHFIMRPNFILHQNRLLSNSIIAGSIVLTALK
ncbi:unnamed protein product [Hermetia illucens]|uniref:Uncharacterized protein n=1 Tax=Hermetia illucens TaxID=343691 RepID=A0A7R8YLB5_HERIL|nr:unnamed protein product [Hermetia illucens]